MAESFIYIVGMNKFYLTNKTNVTALWDVVERELGSDKDLEISYHDKEGDTYYTTTPARKQKVKKLCQEVVRNRILIHETGDMTGDVMSIQQDLYRGRD
jgi:hypothetical protein